MSGVAEPLIQASLLGEAIDSGPVIDRRRFLAETAYCPMPTLVEAARELFNTGEVRAIHRARAATLVPVFAAGGPPRSGRRAARRFAGTAP